MFGIGNSLVLISLIALTILILLVWFFVTWLTRKRSVERRALWAGGIPRLLPQMTYTATGFSNPVRVVFQSIFQPNITEDTRQTVAVHFRTAIHRQREETHVVDRAFLRPVRMTARWIAEFLARMRHGRLDAYVAYVLAFLLLILFLYRVTYEAKKALRAADTGASSVRLNRLLLASMSCVISSPLRMLGSFRRALG